MTLLINPISIQSPLLPTVTSFSLALQTILITISSRFIDCLCVNRLFRSLFLTVPYMRERDSYFGSVTGGWHLDKHTWCYEAIILCSNTQVLKVFLTQGRDLKPGIHTGFLCCNFKIILLRQNCIMSTLDLRQLCTLNINGTQA